MSRYDSILKVVKGKKKIIVLSLIIIFGIVLRLYALGSNTLWFDESISALQSKAILEKGIPELDSGAVITGTWTFHYIQAFFMTIFGINDYGVRLVSVFFGVLTIVLAFFIGREFGVDKKQKIVSGLLGALFTSIFYFEVVYSRQGRFYQMFQFFFFLSLYLLYKSKDDKKYAYLSSISLLIALDIQLEALVLIPFFFISFIYDYKKHRDWKIFIIPILATLYYGKSLLFLPYGDSSLASNYVQDYSMLLFNGLRAFFFISLIGIPFLFKLNKRLSLTLIIPSIVLVLGLFSIKLFALRYAYFIIFLLIMMISVLFSFIYKQNKILFVIVLLFSILYPSNLFFEHNYLTVVNPESITSAFYTEPLIEYHFNESTREVILGSKIVALSTPGVEWYLKKPEYFIPFSLNGLENGYMLHNGKDFYTNAEEFNFTSSQEKEFVLIEDSFGYGKLDSFRREGLDNMKKECSLIDKTNSVNAYSCVL